jgi:hypothetical protein
MRVLAGFFQFLQLVAFAKKLIYFLCCRLRHLYAMVSFVQILQGKAKSFYMYEIGAVTHKMT